MAARAVRRSAAVVALVAVLAGVGLFVGVWLLGDGGGNDPDPEADGPAGDPEDPAGEAATTTAIASVEDLAAALGCAGVDVGDDSTWVPVPDVDSGGCGQAEGGHTAGLHVAGSAAAQEDLVAYFETSSWELPAGADPGGCPGDTPEEARARGTYHVVVGERWVVTTHDAAVAAEAEDVMDGAPASFSPAPQPPPSYVPGPVGGPCPPA